MIDKPLPLSIRPSKQFRRDVKKLRKSGYDVNRLESLVQFLADGIFLAPSFKNHRLQGEYAGKEECHLGFDWILIYERSFEEGILRLARSGTHSDLFKK
jgi:mRNA interferase YafQ